MSRKQTTGRFDTRAELCADVWSRWLNTKSNQTDIARACRVSPATVAGILKSKESMPQQSNGANTMNYETNVKIADASLALRTILVNFMPSAQRRVLTAALRGEEAEGIADVVLLAVERIKGTPVTYATEEMETADKVLHLHYFMGCVDAWIIERDVGDTPDGNGEGKQLQAFGKITIAGDGWQGSEWGYISISELIENGVELDLYWTPKTVKEMK